MREREREREKREREREITKVLLVKSQKYCFRKLGGREGGAGRKEEKKDETKK